MSDIHYSYFMVKFVGLVDWGKTIQGAPCLIYDHYLSVKPWTPKFVAANSKINTTMVWIRISGLGMHTSAIPHCVLCGIEEEPQ